MDQKENQDLLGTTSLILILLALDMNIPTRENKTRQTMPRTSMGKSSRTFVLARVKFSN